MELPSNILLCSICHEQFTRPKVLPCQHTYCYSCLLRLVGEEKSVTCPQCRSVHQLPTGVQGLPDNLTINSILDMQSLTSLAPDPYAETVLCCDCENAASVSSCDHCQQKLCSKCLVKHARLVDRIENSLFDLKEFLQSQPRGDEDKNRENLDEMRLEKEKLDQEFSQVENELKMRRQYFHDYFAMIEMLLQDLSVGEGEGEKVGEACAMDSAATGTGEVKSTCTSVESLTSFLSESKTCSSLESLRLRVNDARSAARFVVRGDRFRFVWEGVELGQLARVEAGEAVVKIDGLYGDNIERNERNPAQKVSPLLAEVVPPQPHVAKPQPEPQLTSAQKEVLRQQELLWQQIKNPHQAQLQAQFQSLDQPEEATSEEALDEAVADGHRSPPAEDASGVRERNGPKKAAMGELTGGKNKIRTQNEPQSPTLPGPERAPSTHEKQLKSITEITGVPDRKLIQNAIQACAKNGPVNFHEVINFLTTQEGNRSDNIKKNTAKKEVAVPAVVSVPDVAAQKDDIARLLGTLLREGDTWFLIDATWFKKWKKYVGFEHWDTQDAHSCSPRLLHKEGFRRCSADRNEDAGKEAVYPGVIDNGPILKDGTGDLKDHLIEEYDYVLLPQEAWDKLVSWYTLRDNQEPIQRRVIEQGMFVKQCKVEVYLMDLKLARHSDMQKVTVCQFSRADTVGRVERKMRELFNIPEDEEVRLWNRYLTNTYEHLDKPENTLQDAGLYQGQLINIEQRNEDGSWPHHTKSGTWK